VRWCTGAPRRSPGPGRGSTIWRRINSVAHQGEDPGGRGWVTDGCVRMAWASRMPRDARPGGNGLFDNTVITHRDLTIHHRRSTPAEPTSGVHPSGRADRIGPSQVFAGDIVWSATVIQPGCGSEGCQGARYRPGTSRAPWEPPPGLQRCSTVRWQWSVVPNHRTPKNFSGESDADACPSATIEEVHLLRTYLRGNTSAGSCQGS
jgi:hypothetical protein